VAELRQLRQSAHRLTELVQDPSSGGGVVLGDVVAEFEQIVTSLWR
jgi:hypothetical protein